MLSGLNPTHFHSSRFPRKINFLYCLTLHSAFLKTVKLHFSSLACQLLLPPPLSLPVTSCPLAQSSSLICVFGAELCSQSGRCVQLFARPPLMVHLQHSHALHSSFLLGSLLPVPTLPSVSHQSWWVGQWGKARGLGVWVCPAPAWLHDLEQVTGARLAQP